MGGCQIIFQSLRSLNQRDGAEKVKTIHIPLHLYHLDLVEECVLVRALSDSNMAMLDYIIDFQYCITNGLDSVINLKKYIMLKHYMRETFCAKMDFSSIQLYCFVAGRRVAELEMHIVLAQLMRNFKINFTEDKPLKYVVNLCYYPERKMDLTFSDL